MEAIYHTINRKICLQNNCYFNKSLKIHSPSKVANYIIKLQKKEKKFISVKNTHYIRNTLI